MYTKQYMCTSVPKMYSVLCWVQVNSKLVQLLVQQGGEVPTEKNKEEKNVLHIMAEQCCKTSLTQLLLILAGQVRVELTFLLASLSQTLTFR